MICVIEKIVDANYSVSYTSPLFNIISEKNRIAVLKKLMLSFEIRLDSIKFNSESASTKFIGFTKFYGNTFVDVSIGIEELTIVFNRLNDGQLAFFVIDKIISALTGFEDFEINNQKVAFWKHYQTSEDIKQYFDELNPYTPDDFESLLQIKGAFYNLRDEDNNCNITVLANRSAAVKDGVFIHTDFHVHPNLFSHKQMFSYAGTMYNKIAKSLQLDILEGTEEKK